MLSLFPFDAEQLWVLDSVPRKVETDNSDGEVEVLQTLASLPPSLPSRKVLSLSFAAAGTGKRRPCARAQRGARVHAGSLLATPPDGQRIIRRSLPHTRRRAAASRCRPAADSPRWAATHPSPVGPVAARAPPASSPCCCSMWSIHR